MENQHAVSRDKTWEKLLVGPVSGNQLVAVVDNNLLRLSGCQDLSLLNLMILNYITRLIHFRAFIAEEEIRRGDNCLGEDERMVF